MASDPASAVYKTSAVHNGSVERPSLAATIGLIWFFVLILSLVATQVPRPDETVPVAVSYFADFE